MADRPEQLLHHILGRASAPAADADAALLRRYVGAGDEQAFAVLVGRHWGLVWGVCRRVLRDAHEAEDAAQATFLLLARKPAAVRRPERLTAWLHGTAHRLALNCRKARRRQRRAARGLRAAPLPPQPDAVAELSAQEVQAIVDEELLWLPQVYRLPVILCCLEGHTLAEAARQLGWSPGSVQGRLKRGRARLRARLARRGLTLAGALAAVEASGGAASAGMSALLAEAAARAALAFAAGRGAAGPEVAHRAATLAEEALRGTVHSRLMVMGAVLGSGLAAVAAGALGHQGPPAPPPQAAAEPRERPRAAESQQVVLGAAPMDRFLPPGLSLTQLRVESTQPAGRPILVALVLTNTTEKPIALGPEPYLRMDGVGVRITDPQGKVGEAALENSYHGPWGGRFANSRPVNPRTRRRSSRHCRREVTRSKSGASR
jgi:RNA polymerase sigma factor (sigma-70 family)